MKLLIFVFLLLFIIPANAQSDPNILLQSANAHTHSRQPFNLNRKAAGKPIILGGRPSGCPHRYCGCWLALHLGMPNRSLWLAINWSRIGQSARPAPGVVVVWRHHVGLIKDVSGNKARVLSGNDGRAVRERWRSIQGAVAFRRI